MARPEPAMLALMRKLMADGWHEESLLVDHAAELAGGDDKARKQAQAVFDRHMKIHGAA